LNYANIIDFARSHKDSLIEKRRIKAALEFMSKMNTINFEEKKDLQAIKTIDEALSIAGSVIEEILESMEKGEI